ncbi:MAG: prolyl oligopeptidase family serine peptidase [Pyrinomonadaceae bacterium]
MKSRIFVLFVIFLSAAVAFGQKYEKPPKEIQDVLDSPVTPSTSVSPAKDKILLLEPLRYPPISELAEPMLRLAGLRINPNANSQHRERYFVKLWLKNISDGKETPIDLPNDAKITSPNWSADGKYIAVGNITPTGIELWIIETDGGKAKKLKNVQVNTAYGGYDWMPDQKSLWVTMVPQNRGPAPSAAAVPNSPSIQETSGSEGAIRTFQDLLSSPTDEKLFDYYATSQLAVVGIDGKIREIEKPAIFDTVSPSPDGKYFLTSRIQHPYSYLFPHFYFPREVEVWNNNGTMIHKVADIPLQDNLPVQGVPTGKRSYEWIPTENATLMWAEALDGGDPRNKVTPRDKLMKLAAPFATQPTEVIKIEQRYSGRQFGEKDGMMWFFDYNRDTQRRRIFMIDYRTGGEPKMISDLNVRDRYNAPGSPVMKTMANGSRVILQRGDDIFLEGNGATPEGDRPFLRRMNLKTLKTEEIFRCGTDVYEDFVALMDDQANAFITRRESPSEPPNLILRDRTNTPEATANATSMKPLTDFQDPAPQLRGIKKQLVKYKRADGVDLSFTLYLPPDYKQGTPLPTVVWAYPLEYTNAATAGQISGSSNRFTQIGGYSHLFFLLEGYAVLDDATMPIVGDPLTVNDTFVEQLVSSAKAAIDKGVEMGVVDPNRVGVGGHSYGAFMTAHLLAYSDLFRAGIARSGAYNRTLTPFGFQSERRSFWEAPEIYFKLSPFMHADKINEPMLMIHGEADNNSGTFPIQSERMFAAIKGNGGTARLVMLPFESHGYSGRESIEHVLYEQIRWFDKYVKNATPRDGKP